VVTGENGLKKRVLCDFRLYLANPPHNIKNIDLLKVFAKSRPKTYFFLVTVITHNSDNQSLLILHITEKHFILTDDFYYDPSYS
jgi:uncharacterized protein (DUF488 family)